MIDASLFYYSFLNNYLIICIPLHKYINQYKLLLEKMFYYWICAKFGGYIPYFIPYRQNWVEQHSGKNFFKVASPYIQYHLVPNIWEK